MQGSIDAARLRGVAPVDDLNDWTRAMLTTSGVDKEVAQPPPHAQVHALMPEMVSLGRVDPFAP